MDSGGAQVNIAGRLLETQFGEVQTLLRELSSGTVQAETGATEPDSIIPIHAPLLRVSQLT